MASNNFWTTPTYAPMQQFKFDVQTNLWRADIDSAGPDGRVEINYYSAPGQKERRYTIPKELIKAVNLPDTTFGYDNDAANIGSGGPNIESQDPQISELELQFYMTGELLTDLQDIFYTYYLQDLQTDSAGNPLSGKVPVIMNKDRVSFQPAFELIENSEITVNIYKSLVKTKQNLNGQKLSNLGLIRSIKYYGVYPVSYNLGSLDYSSSDVVVGNMKFYFYGYEIVNPNREGSISLSDNVLGAIGAKRQDTKNMGNF